MMHNRICMILFSNVVLYVLTFTGRYFKKNLFVFLSTLRLIQWFICYGRIWPELLQRLISTKFIKMTYVGFSCNQSCKYREPTLFYHSHREYAWNVRRCNTVALFKVTWGLFWVVYVLTTNVSELMQSNWFGLALFIFPTQNVLPLRD